MAIPQLTEDQIRTWTREQKDRWWLEKVYRGSMPQLTLRSALTGFILGGALSATNLYIGAKTGWTLGVGLTSVILAFATFKLLSSLGAKDMTILENNASQSVATAAGYMTGPLISGIAAYMMVTNTVMPWWQMMLFNVVLSILGVLVAFPMKRRFINDEQAPFPEGAACGVVLDTLYSSDANVGIFKAKVLAFAALLAGGLKFITGESYQTFLQAKVLGLSTVRWISEHLDGWYYDLVANKAAPMPLISGIDPRKLGLSPTLDLAMFGAGGLMNIRYAVNMFLGMIAAYVIAAPIAINNGWVFKQGVALTADAAFKQRDVLTSWLLWPGVAMLVCASMTAFFAKPKLIIKAFTGVFSKKQAGSDPLAHIEVPLWISWVGIPLVGAVGVIMAHEWFQVRWDLGALAILLTIVLTLIAANATAATSITPTGSLSKITQFTFGVLDPKHAPTNLMTATITTEVASNASNLLMDIKPGYMLGGKPRHQVWGHIIGIIAGACASTPLFYVLFMPKYKAGDNLADTLITDTFSFTAAVQWKGISEFIGGLTGDAGLTAIIHPSALSVMAVAAFIGVLFELVRTFTKGKFPFAPVAFALGVVLPPDSTFWMFLGAVFFWFCGKVFGKSSNSNSLGKRVFVETHEPICAGLIAGAALIGIGDILVGAFLL
ncbi:MAG: OPT/YSL family transporter [Phycisphaerales bacterium]|nr:OPT/YSL family transporter [Phycisphaerales bacterium]